MCSLEGKVHLWRGGMSLPNRVYAAIYRSFFFGGGWVGRCDAGNADLCFTLDGALLLGQRR